MGLINEDKLDDYVFKSASERMDLSVEYMSGWNDAIHHIKANAPTVDAEPVRHGHWNGIEMDSRGYTDIFECSECKCYVRTPFMMKVMEYDFCPSCGADMRGEDSEHE